MVAAQSCGAEAGLGSATDMEPWVAAVESSMVSRRP